MITGIVYDATFSLRKSVLKMDFYHGNSNRNYLLNKAAKCHLEVELVSIFFILK